MPEPPPPPTFALRGLSVELGGREILHGIDAELRAGEWVALVGPNGAGKTTLLRAMAGLLPHGGALELGGRPVRSWPERERARAVAFVRQRGDEAFAYTVRQTVELGRAPHTGWVAPLGAGDHAAVDRALDAVGLRGDAGRTVTALSGGEQQRVRLAQALAQDAPTLLLDEPTAHLDVRHRLDLLGRARALADGGRTVVAALHDLGWAARYADRLLLLAAGRLVADGAPAEVLTPENLAAVFGVEARVEPAPDGLRVHFLRPSPPDSPA